jgi:hypothetical protein
MLKLKKKKRFKIMPKFFVSNNSSFIKKAQEIIEKNGFQIVFLNIADNLASLTTKKLKIDNCNAGLIRQVML